MKLVVDHPCADGGLYQDIKIYKRDINHWRCKSEGKSTEASEELLSEALQVSKQSRVTYLEANLVRHLRKEVPSQLESNAMFDYLTKYATEVPQKLCNEWIVKHVILAFRKHAPLVKTPEGLKKIAEKDWLWRDISDLEARMSS